MVNFEFKIDKNGNIILEGENAVDKCTRIFEDLKKHNLKEYLHPFLISWTELNDYIDEIMPVDVFSSYQVNTREILRRGLFDNIAKFYEDKIKTYESINKLIEETK